MRKIVVGVDGSASSLAALAWAYDEARLSAGELTVVHAWAYPYSGYRVTVSEPRDLMELDARRELEAALKTLDPDVFDRPHPQVGAGDVRIHSRLVEDPPGRAILDNSAEADLIVVGSRGRGGFRSMLLGSVSRTVVDYAPCPVVVVRTPPDDEPSQHT